MIMVRAFLRVVHTLRTPRCSLRRWCSAIACVSGLITYRYFTRVIIFALDHLALYYAFIAAPCVLCAVPVSFRAAFRGVAPHARAAKAAL